MYRRQTACLDDILGHLRFVVLSPATAPPELPLLCSLFELRFKRYLAGRGHPQWFRQHGLVATGAEIEQAAEVPFLRVQLLLLTALESSLLPIKDSWGNQALYQFSISSQLQTSSPSTTAPPSPLQFHTCSGGVDVRVNAKLFEMMIKSSIGDEQTEFDIWVHTQIYNADLTYNTV
ncbi:hypothetical protein MVEN_01328500 [Mycena venus]|uniref:Uncharacterized protein n=1 Tax=Mycena venus TaxID=2733690 RepID=A0A8H6XXT2_9AGAR|nr:hypothetical protein MVEN_01328500 [Mycena venus]